MLNCEFVMVGHLLLHLKKKIFVYYTDSTQWYLSKAHFACVCLRNMLLYYLVGVTID